MGFLLSAGSCLHPALAGVLWVPLGAGPWALPRPSPLLLALAPDAGDTGDISRAAFCTLEAGTVGALGVFVPAATFLQTPPGRAEGRK